MAFNEFLGVSEIGVTSLLAGGKPATVSGIENVAQQIKRLLLTDEASVFYNVSYGSKLYKLQFLPNDAVTQSLIKSFISDALKTLPLVKSHKTTFERQSISELLIFVSFVTKSNQEGETSFVFNFQ